MVIRAVLGLELQELQDHSIHIVDLSFSSLDWFQQKLSIPPSTRLIIIPIHHGSEFQHWSIAGVDVQEGQVRHCDSVASSPFRKEESIWNCTVFPHRKSQRSVSHPLLTLI